MPQFKLLKQVLLTGYIMHPVFINEVNKTKNNNNKNKTKNLLKIKKISASI
jgi:hypothetical protein